ncbi:MAG: Lrp/AsnC family transcriptional regulator [Clostridia bacterium]|nr:Lrp/AsnC family transcriptional regulator [Clostridia bacterium]MBQ1933717.1 Lrp/AsnC family transcriptional regulator [Clostridia bacterium]MBQ5808674.1 Lrp/AsnC family transcriptional regulator [Clostridia bacterium]
MNKELLEIIEKNARLSNKDIAVMLSKEEGDIKKMIEKYEKDGVIVGYRALIDWDKTENEHVNALIELRVSPQPDRGFDKLAEKIGNYPEVSSLYLMSGGYDFMVLLEGKTMREIAYFVAQKLAPLDTVITTATHFVLRKYKDKGVTYGPVYVDERSNCL